jgi:redox-sensitive bicupin YhaK (pirin superfamily)
MFPLLDRNAPNPVELFQIWLNLPRAEKMVEPQFSMLWSGGIPRHTVRDAAGRTTEITVIAGALDDVAPPAPPPHSWAARPESDVAIWSICMQPGAAWTLPPARPGTHRTLYWFAGSGLRVGDRTIAKPCGMALRPDVAAPLLAAPGPGEVELLLLQGRPIGEPVAQHGPFVMNSRAEIQQAFVDYQRTRFGGWPWPSEAPVHGHEGRFARHADGRVERVPE